MKELKNIFSLLKYFKNEKKKMRRKKTFSFCHLTRIFLFLFGNTNKKVKMSHTDESICYCSHLKCSKKKIYILV